MKYPTRDEIVSANPIDVFLAEIGHPIIKAGSKHVAKCPFHDDKSPSMSVDVVGGVWFCHACGFGGSVIDLLMRHKGLSCKEALHQLADRAHLLDPNDAEKWNKTATYDYRDSHGRPVMKVDRLEQGFNVKKKFAQYHEGPTGERINTLDGVQRVLYRMDKWAGKSEVALCEGEKCADALTRLCYSATCNPGGSSSWCDAFATYLTDKHVDIWPDNDAAGQKWLTAVMKSLEQKCSSVRIVTTPAPYNDVSDWITAQGEQVAADLIREHIDKIPRVVRGANIPVLSSQECYDLYKQRITALDSDGIDLSRWIPSFRERVRCLLPGDLAVFLSDTGVGKTSVLVNIAQSQRPIPVLFVELELSPEPMCERFISHTHEENSLDVERLQRGGREFDVSAWNHVFMCTESKVDLKKLEFIIENMELKTRQRPRLVLIDYVGLLSGVGEKRYERMSTIAEGLKILARSTETVIIMASQVRRDPEREEIELHDAKDSGAIECSAQLILGAWRPSVDTMAIKVLKQTKGTGEIIVNCRFDGNRQIIREL